MPDLAFAVTGVRAVADGWIPLLEFTLEIQSRPECEDVRALLLQIEVHIQPSEGTSRRMLSACPGESSAARGSGVAAGAARRYRWTHVHTTVPAFAGTIAVPLLVPCSYDLNLAATRWFAACASDTVELAFEVGGTIIHMGDGAGLQVQPIPCGRDAIFAIPGATWMAMMEQHYPNSAWLYCRRDVIERLHAFKSDGDFDTWEEALEELLAAAGCGAVSRV